MYQKTVKNILGGLSGSLLLISLSSLQRLQIGISISPEGFVLPGVVGFLGAFFLAKAHFKIKSQNIELEEKVNHRTRELEEVNNFLLIQNTRYIGMFENMSSGATVLESTDNGSSFIITGFNRSAEKIEDISRDQVIGKDIREAFPGIIDFGLYEIFQQVYSTGQAEHFSAGKYHDSRIQGWRENYVYKLPTGEMVAIYDDVTDRKIMEENLQTLANVDHLTGISNRRHFIDMVERELKKAKRYNLSSAFLMLDLDHFKKINDTYGHDIGDLVLKTFSTTCQRLLREVDEFGRLGGEEFGVLLTGTSINEAMQVAERVRQQVLHMNIKIPRGIVAITVSIGIAGVENGLLSSTSLMKNADLALYKAKEQGRNRVIACDQ